MDGGFPGLNPCVLPSSFFPVGSWIRVGDSPQMAVFVNESGQSPRCSSFDGFTTAGLLLGCPPGRGQMSPEMFPPCCGPSISE
eukprot:7237580-Heterocapsa_arctica.AAC.1